MVETSARKAHLLLVSRPDHLSLKILLSILMRQRIDSKITIGASSLLVKYLIALSSSYLLNYSTFKSKLPLCS